MLNIVCNPPPKNGENYTPLKMWPHNPLDVFDTFPKGASMCLKMPILTKILTSSKFTFRKGFKKMSGNFK